MDRMVADWSDVVMKRDDYEQILDAVMECNYPALYAGLRKVKRAFNHHESYQLCSAAIESGCTLKAFETILQHCEPTLEEFVNYCSGHNYILHGYQGSCGGLVQEAAWYVRSDLLKYMLDHGCSPNARGKSDCSALEAALGNGAIGSISVLEARDDVDFTITETILRLWGSMGQEGMRDICFRMIAGRLLGEGKGVFHPEIPLLPGMQIGHAADHENWPLVCRMLREQTEVTEKQCKDVLGRYLFMSGTWDAAGCAELLDAMFSACPNLLRCEQPRYVLSLCMLSGDEAVAERMRPWVDRMPGRTVVLCGHRLGEPDYDLFACLERWEERMGPRWKPVLRRDKLLPVRSMAQVQDQEIRFLLECCHVRGTPKAGQVSRLAMDLLQLASPGLLAELCQDGKVFDGETMDLLLQYCEENLHHQSQQKKDILLAYGKTATNHEL